MRRRHTGQVHLAAYAFLAVGLLVSILGCAGATSSPAGLPATSPIALSTTSTPIPRPTQFVPTGTLPPTGFHGDWALEAWALHQYQLPEGPGFLSMSGSVSGSDAVQVVDQRGWLMASVCRDPQHLSLAHVNAGVEGAASFSDSFMAIRLAGADTGRLRDFALRHPELVGGSDARSEALRIEGRDVVRIIDESRTGSTYRYAVGDIIFAIASVTPGRAEDVVRQLPPTGTDTSVLGSAVEPARADCPGLDDLALLELLPSEIDGRRLTPTPVTFMTLSGLASQGDFITATGANGGNFSGYLLAADLGYAFGAYRVSGVSSAVLERACGSLMDAEEAPLVRKIVGGKSVLVLDGNPPQGACYVQEDMIFWELGGLLAEFFASIR